MERALRRRNAAASLIQAQFRARKARLFFAANRRAMRARRDGRRREAEARALLGSAGGGGGGGGGGGDFERMWDDEIGAYFWLNRATGEAVWTDPG